MQKRLIFSPYQTLWLEESEAEFAVYLGVWSLTPEKMLKVCENNFLSYHWNNREKAYSDYIRLEKIHRQILSQVATRLNQFHQTDYSEKAWDMMIGYWLFQFIVVTYDRYYMLRLASQTHPELVSVLNDKIPSKLPPKNVQEATNDFSSHHFNYIFYYQILRHLNTIALITLSSASDLGDLEFSKHENLHNPYFKLLLSRQINRAIGRFCSDGPGYILSTNNISYLNLLRLRRLLNGNIYVDPEFLDHYEPKNCEVERTLSIPPCDGDSKFVEILKELIPMWIPLSFVENFSSLKKSLKNSKLPLNVNVIFADYNQFSNDSFRIWLAEKIDSGSKFVCGQHGSGPFHKFNGGRAYELRISDLFASTGSGNCSHSPSIRDVGQYWRDNFTIGQWNSNGFALVTSVAFPPYAFDLRSMILCEQMINYLDDQFLFYRNLPERIQKRALIRLYPEDYGWNQKLRWKSNFPEVMIDEGKVRINKIASKCRIFISTYNATTYNQSLAANIPTVMYWNPNHWEWADFAAQDFAALQSVGIYHDNPQSAARHVAMIWDDVGDWWYSSEVQFVRKEFCRKYAYLGKDVIRKLAAVLKEASNYE